MIDSGTSVVVVAGGAGAGEGEGEGDELSTCIESAADMADVVGFFGCAARHSWGAVDESIAGVENEGDRLVQAARRFSDSRIWP